MAGFFYSSRYWTVSHPDSVSLSQSYRIGQFDLDLSAVEGPKHTQHLQPAVVQPAGKPVGLRTPARFPDELRGVLPCGWAGFISHALPESAASTPVADVTNYDALQTGQLNPLSIQLQLLHKETHTPTITSPHSNCSPSGSLCGTILPPNGHLMLDHIT